MATPQDRREWIGQGKAAAQTRLHHTPVTNTILEMEGTSLGGCSPHHCTHEHPSSKLPFPPPPFLNMNNSSPLNKNTTLVSAHAHHKRLEPNRHVQICARIWEGLIRRLISPTMPDTIMAT